MSDSNEFPRLVYKAAEKNQGNAQPVWDRWCEVQEVADQAAQDAALASGWTLRPDEDPAPPSEFTLLDEKVAVIVEHLPALTGEELTALLAAEQSGKTRKGVIEPIEAELAARAKAQADADAAAAAANQATS